MKIRAFITHKKAETFVDCQDRFGINETTKSIAVSDGMSQSWQQKRWAQLLVDAYTESEDWIPNQESIKPLCGQWHKQVVEYIDYLKNSNAKENIIYRNERNLAEGRSAGATFVGIRFYGKEWKGYILGDSCLIEWNGENAAFYTSQVVESFDNHPDYFDSNIFNEGKGTPVCQCGVLDNNSCLFLVSDPFSDYLLELSKLGDITEYIQQLLKLSSHEEFEVLVDGWRKAGMHNDDTTLVIVEPDDSDIFSIDISMLDDIEKLIEKEKKELEQKESSKELVLVPDCKDEEVEENDCVDNAVIEDDKHEEITEEQSCSQQLRNVLTENEPVNKVETEAEKTRPPVGVKTIVDEFLLEYRKELQKKIKVNALKELGFKMTQKAASIALEKVLNKYSICKKQ